MSKAHIIPKTGAMTVAITDTELKYFGGGGGRIALFRIWRKACLQKMAQSWGSPAVLASIEIKSNPILQERVYYMTVTGREVIEP